GLGRGGADLEAQRAGQLATGGEQGLAAVGGVVQDVAQFVDQRGVLGGQRGAVVIGGGAVGGLGGQVLHAQHDVGELLEGALGGLHQRDAVLGVLRGDRHAAGLGQQAGGDLQAGGVVGGRVDLVARAQAGHRGVEGALVAGQGVLDV